MDKKTHVVPEPDCTTDTHHDGYGHPAYSEEALRAYGVQCYREALAYIKGLLDECDLPGEK